VDYVLKTIKRGRVSYDEGVLILPRARGELTSRVMPGALRQLWAGSGLSVQS
jgi:hypothetical protein